MIDGFSRKIIYVRVAPDKLPETVGAMFVEGCDTYGWAYRCVYLRFITPRLSL
jgi:hypothetical protein